jgi:signal transduction histidine kinase
MNSTAGQNNIDYVKPTFSQILKRFVLTFVPLFIIVVLILSTIYYSQLNAVMNKINDVESLVVDLQKNQIQLYSSSLFSHIRFLAQSKHFEQIIDETGEIDPKVKTIITNEFLSFSKTSLVYDQIRFIGNNGMELIRVNLNNGKPYAVTDKKLQNKNDRYYFRLISQMEKNHIYISALDLNIEQNEVETPYKPMLRLGMPVFNTSGNKIGLVIVNYLANNFLTLIAETGQINPGEFMLLNDTGYWLKSKNPDDEWGFMFSNRLNRRFANKYEAEWRKIKEMESGQFENLAGVFTFETVYPFRNKKSINPETGLMATNKIFWKIVSFVPTAYIQSEKGELLYAIFPLLFLLTTVLVFGSWRLALLSIQKVNKDGELIKINEQLEEKVSSRTRQLTAINKDLARQINKQKRTEKLLQKQTAELQRSNKELVEFAHVASHDLQEPLRKIKSFSDLLARRYQGKFDAQGDTYLTFISSAVDRMSNLIFDLLKYSRVGSAELTLAPVDLNEVIKIVENDFEMRINETNTEICYENLPEVMADKTQIVQLMQNLVANAIKYQCPEKEITPKIKIFAEDQQEKWLIAVEDNGIGIDKKHYEKIFIIFQRLHGRKEYSGTGIGLGVCKKIVERHGGTIWVKSKTGKGSTFYFTIAA